MTNNASIYYWNSHPVANSTVACNPKRRYAKAKQPAYELRCLRQLDTLDVPLLLVQYVYQLCNALNYLHTKSVIHRYGN